jgi:hypothetical protein
MKGYFWSLSQIQIAAIPILSIDIPTQSGKKCKFSVKKTAMYCSQKLVNKSMFM